MTKVKGKGKGLDTCYSAAYMSQTRDQQQRFTISEVATDGAAAHFVAIHCRVNGQLQLADRPSPQSATLGLHAVTHNR